MAKKKKKNKRTPSSGRNAPARKGTPPTEPSDLVPKLVAAKREITRHMRALDAVGVDPREHPDLPRELVALAEADALLIRTIEVYDRSPEDAGEDTQPLFEELFHTVRRVLENMLGALPAEIAEEVRAYATVAGASAAEVWLEVDQLRKAQRKASREKQTPPDPLEGPDLEAFAKTAFADGPGGVPTHPTVTRLEARSLPEYEDDVSTWLAPLPKPWLVAMAWMHGVDPGLVKAELIERLAASILDVESLAVVLREALGPLERHLLVGLAIAGEVSLAELEKELGGAFEIPFDQWDGLPAAPGAKLRALGLVFLGRRLGEPLVAVPEDVVMILPEALQRAAPKEWEALPEGLRADLEAVASDREAWFEAIDEVEQDGGFLDDETDDDEADDDEGPGPLFGGEHPRLRALPPAPVGAIQVYELKVTLLETSPPIWRRLRVAGDRTLLDLHLVLQTAFGWKDSHLHEFHAPDRSWCFTNPHFDLPGAGDEDDVTIQALAPRKGSRFLYLYDFGDDWTHEIRVTERLDPKKAGVEPRCLDGARAGPPEDSGGTWGYEHLLEVLADPKHEEHDKEEYDHLRAWVADDFDPERFEIDEVNARLRVHFPA